MMFCAENLLKAVIITLCCRYFFELWEQNNEPALWKKRMVTVLGIVGLFACGFVPEEILGVRILAEVAILTVLMFFYKDMEFRNTLCLVAFYDVFVRILDYVEIYLETVFSFEEIAGGEGIWLLISVLCTLLLVPIVCVLKRILNRRTALVSLRDEWNTFLIFTIVMISVLASCLEVLKWGMLVLLIGMLIGNIAVFYIFSDLLKKQKLLVRERILKTGLENEIENYKTIRQALEQQRSRSHEFKNYINAIYYMIELEKYDEVKNFVHSVRGNMHTKTEAIYHTGHLLADAIFNAKYKEALAQEVRLVIDADSLEGIFIKDEDVVVIFSNLLNNALEATAKCESDRYIFMKIKQEDKGIRIITENSHCNVICSRDEQILTTKEDSDNHGFGIQNIRAAVAKYDGTCDITYTDKKFVINIFLHAES